MDLGFFILSVLFLVWISWKKGIRALSLYWIFIAFQCLYNITPWVVSLLDFQPFLLLNDHEVINTQLRLAASANVCFGIVFLGFFKEMPLGCCPDPGTQEKRRNFVLCVLPVFVLACLLCAEYGWNALSAGMATGSVSANPGGMYGLAINAKFLYLGIYLYYLYRFGLDKWAWVLLAGDVIILMIDGARTTFLPIALVTLIIYNNQAASTKKMKLYALAFVGLVISVGARAAFVEGNSGFVKMLVPITVEGTMGAYPSLQSIYAIQHHFNNGYTYGASYVIDPIAWTILPHGDFRERVQFFAPWTRSISDGIVETFAPAGGFYYISEAVAAFSYAGPAIITTAFALFLVWLERVKTRHPLFYTTAASTLGVLFVKFIFAGVFKMFLIELAVGCSLLGIHRLRIFLGKALPTSAFYFRQPSQNET